LTWDKLVKQISNHDRVTSIFAATVVDYGQKNRYEIETQNIQEQLRLQEMAQSNVSQEEREETSLNGK